MEFVLVITNSIDTKMEVIACKTMKEAVDKMKSTYDKMRKEKEFDYSNTYFDEDEGYAQIVNGLEYTEFRIGKFKKSA